MNTHRYKPLNIKRTPRTKVSSNYCLIMYSSHLFEASRMNKNQFVYSFLLGISISLCFKKFNQKILEILKHISDF